MKSIFKDNYRFYSVLGVIVLIIVFTFQTCNYRLQMNGNKKTLVPPFIVIDKRMSWTPGFAEYTYQDKLGTTSVFLDDISKFTAGDTLK